MRRRDERESVPSSRLWGMNEHWDNNRIQGTLVKRRLVSGDCTAIGEIADRGRAMSRIWNLLEKVLPFLSRFVKKSEPKAEEPTPEPAMSERAETITAEAPVEEEVKPAETEPPAEVPPAEEEPSPQDGSSSKEG
jgi:hypothetical protein